MKRGWMYAGWLTAAVAIVAAGCGFVWGWHQNRELTELRAQVISLNLERQKLIEARSEQEAALSALQAKGTEQATPPGPSDEAAESPSSMPSLFGKMMAAVAGGGKEGKPKEGEQDSPFGAFAKMYSGEKGKEMARYSAEMAVNMQYQDLFTSLHLPADVEQRLREVLKESMAEQILSGIEAMGGKASPETMKGTKEGSEADLRAKAAAILSPEEMAAWDEYQAALPKHVLSQSLDMQLNMFAPGLTPETRTRARDVLVEELLTTQAGQQGMGVATGTDFQAQLTAQQEAFTRARDRLAQELDETQIGQVDRLITQMQQMIEMSASMMESSKPKEETPK